MSMKLQNLESTRLLPSVYKNADGSYDSEYICNLFDKFIHEFVDRGKTLRCQGKESFISMTPAEQMQFLKDCGIDWFFADISADNRADYCAWVASHLEVICTKESLEYLMKFVMDDESIEATMKKVSDCEYTILVDAAASVVHAWTTAIVERCKVYVVQFWPNHVGWDGNLHITVMATTKDIVLQSTPTEATNWYECYSADRPDTQYLAKLKAYSNTVYFHDQLTPYAHYPVSDRTLHSVAGSSETSNYLVTTNTYRAFLVEATNGTTPIEHKSSYQVYNYYLNGNRWAVQFPSNDTDVILGNSIKVVMVSDNEIPSKFGLETHDVKHTATDTLDVAFSIWSHNQKWYALWSEIKTTTYKWYTVGELLNKGIEFESETQYASIGVSYKPTYSYTGGYLYDAGSLIAPAENTAYDVVSVRKGLDLTQNFPAGDYERTSVVPSNYTMTDIVDNKIILNPSAAISRAVWVVLKSYLKSVAPVAAAYPMYFSTNGSALTVNSGSTIAYNLYDYENNFGIGSQFPYPTDVFMNWGSATAYDESGNVVPSADLTVSVYNNFANGYVAANLTNNTASQLKLSKIIVPFTRLTEAKAYGRSGSYQPANVTLNAGSQGNLYAEGSSNGGGICYFTRYHGTGFSLSISAFVNRNGDDLGVGNIQAMGNTWTHSEHLYCKIKNISSAAISWSNVTFTAPEI